MLSYDPSTGFLHWKVDRHCGRGRVFARAGTRAGSIDKSTGYERISVNYVHCHSHRLSWLLTHGVWPSGDIDHINGNPSDNRLSNLRDVPHRVNLQNRRKANANNRCGMLGVTERPSGRFAAAITAPTDGSRLSLGLYDSPGEAHEAYLTAKRELHPGCTI